jgi:hypothetical protein
MSEVNPIDDTPLKGFKNPRVRLSEDPKQFYPTEEDVLCEMQLQALDFWEPLKFKVRNSLFEKQIESYNDKWYPYLPKKDVANNREGLTLFGLEGDKSTDSVSMPEAIRRSGRSLNDLDFNQPTELYNDLDVLHPVLETFSPLGRTVLIKANRGSFFTPHKDDPLLTRKTFRIAAFFGNVSDFDWFMCGEKVEIELGRFYYVDTRKTHKTYNYGRSSTHLIVNVPKTWENVMKITTNLMRWEG